MLCDAKVAGLITKQKLLTGLPMQNIPVVCLDKHWEIISQESAEILVNNTTSENLVYVVYTSGSTANPRE